MKFFHLTLGKLRAQLEEAGLTPVADEPLVVWRENVKLEEEL